MLSIKLRVFRKVERPPAVKTAKYSLRCGFLPGLLSASNGPHMWILAGLLLTPLSHLFDLVSTVTNAMVQEASAQVRLDALTLSLCHSRKADLEAHLDPPNKNIQRIATQMDGLALQCLSLPHDCPSILPTLHILSTKGQMLMTLQDVSLNSFHLRQARRKQSLRLENDLLERAGMLMSKEEILSGHSGLDREVLPPDRITYEQALGVTWPKRLLPNNRFTEVNEYSFSWRPKVSVKDQMNVRIEPSSAEGDAVRISECRVQPQGQSWVVER